MKKALALCLMMCLLAGCSNTLESAGADEAAATDARTYFYGESSGRVIVNASDTFDFKLEKWECAPNAQTRGDALSFSILVRNKGETPVKNLDCTVQFPEEAARLFDTGITRYDIFEPVDLVPDIAPYGVGYGSAAGLREGIGEDWRRLTTVTLELTWDGGEESVTLDCGEPNITVPEAGEFLEQIDIT